MHAALNISSSPHKPLIGLRDSSRPNSANISNRGGEVALPVRAARRGWATWPSLRPSGFGKGPGGGFQGRAAPVGRLQRGQGARPGRRGPPASAAWRRPRPGRGDRPCTEIPHPDRVRTRVLARSFSDGMAASSRARAVSDRMRGGVSRARKAVTSATSAVIGGFADVMAVEIVQLLVIHPRRAFADGFEIEPFDRLRGGDDLVIAMAPAQPQQIVAHGLGQIAHVAIGLDRQRAMALGQLGAVGAVDQRQMAIDRHAASPSPR